MPNMLCVSFKLLFSIRTPPLSIEPRMQPFTSNSTCTGWWCVCSTSFVYSISSSSSSNPGWSLPHPCWSFVGSAPSKYRCCNSACLTPSNLSGLKSPRIALSCNSCWWSTKRSWKAALVHSDLGLMIEKSYQSGTKRLRKSGLMAISRPRKGVAMKATRNDPTVCVQEKNSMWVTTWNFPRVPKFTANHPRPTAQCEVYSIQFLSIRTNSQLNPMLPIPLWGTTFGFLNHFNGRTIHIICLHFLIGIDQLGLTFCHGCCCCC